ncbi:ATP-binding protein [Chryseolinea sp. H1M3-3]|uniref:sensor histidine kinase n=1 Tax=Chryseolinea sp. H1M3-3 TaxID=3034144 RepID=UPI0023EABB0F|nr:ATP-binding protein [Chryseolinea sp. H1M3-3]
MPVIFTSRKKFELEISKRAAEICDQIILEMGAELHDDLIQKLSIFRLYLDRLERSAHNPAETEALLINMRTDFESVIQSVRRISRKLLPEQTVNDSLNTSIDMLCQSLERPGFGNIYYECTGTERTIPDLNRMYLYRIIQELIHNAFKHSSAWHVWVRLKWKNENLVIEVEDDGSGFNKISEFIERLRKKNNTLKLRSQAIGASIQYHHGEKGLLAKVDYKL